MEVETPKTSLKTRIFDGFLWCCGPFVWCGAWVRLILRALWVARVSVASLIVAALMFSVVPQAQDLFIDLKWWPKNYLIPWGVVHWTLFYVLALCLWVVPVYFGARLALQINHGRMGIDTLPKYRAIVVYLPRLLGVFCLFAITIGIYSAYWNLPRLTLGADEPILLAARRQLVWLLGSSIALNIALMVLFYFLPTLPVLRRLHLVLTPLYWLLRRLLDWLQQPSSRLIHRLPPPPLPSPLIDPQERTVQRNILVSVIFFLAIIWIINILIVLISPRMAGTYLPRANLVPIILGAMVPALTFLAILSHRLRHPCILYFIAVLVFITSLTPTWHDLKCVPDKAEPKRCAQVPEPRQITLAEAVDVWKAANCTKEGCPQPIVVAGEGGASRAAFFLATVLAHLEDESTKSGWNGGKFSDRLFALSAVSGSSLGAAVFLGAIEARDVKTTKSDPWPDNLSKLWQCNWFGCHSAVEARAKEFGPLKRAVQQVIAGDFLTPVFMALGFHDVWRLERLGMESRAAVLENAWVERFDKIFASDFLRRPLSRIAPRLAPQDRKWRPILVFNGTSVQSGRRVITSTLAKGDVFGNSWDFYGLMCQRHGAQEDNPTDCLCKEVAPDTWEPMCDISVTTAILNSARFPVVSPPGNIKSPPGHMAKGKSELIDLVVDGGYFESSGSLTVTELATALDRYGIPPFILQITNDPESFLDECHKSLHSIEPDVRRPFGFLRDPIDTVLNSRVARGYLATVAARASRHEGSFAHIGVCPEEEDESEPSASDKNSRTGERGGKYKQLSYSWWLSMPVQQYLNNQLDQEWNRKGIALVLNSLRQSVSPQSQPPTR
jgi:hypothetical protein